MSEKLMWSKREGEAQPYELLAHLLDTAAAAKVLVELWVNENLSGHFRQEMGEMYAGWVMAACGLHDIGKADPVFQLQLAKDGTPTWQLPLKEKLDSAGYNTSVERTFAQSMRYHSETSGLHLANKPLDINSAVRAELFAVAGLGHHGHFTFPQRPTHNGHRDFACGQWKDTRDNIQQIVMDACGVSGTAPKVSPMVSILVAGLTILADRSASEEDSMQDAVAALQCGELDIDDPKGWIENRTAWFRKRMASTLGFYRDFKDARAEILPGITQLHPIQEAALHTGRGLWFAMAPTGCGKTEAAFLRHSLFPERLIFTLPTQATTNAIMTRTEKIFANNPNTASLVHGLADVNDFNAPGKERNTLDEQGGLAPSSFVERGTADLLAAVSIATIDQILDGALRDKWAHLKLLLLANAHVIIDEAHTMDKLQTRLGMELMKWLGKVGARVTILTATISRGQRDAIAESYFEDYEGEAVIFPSHEEVPGRAHPIEATKYQIDLSVTESEDPIEAHVQWALEQRARHPKARIGIVVNTVARSQKVTRALQAAGHDVNILNSRMTAFHRGGNADELITGLGPKGISEGTFLVGTQAVEASLDISLDMLSTDLAPAPSLIQRAGRVHRHRPDLQRLRIPSIANLPLHVVRGIKPRASLPYFSTELSRTWGFISGRETLKMPCDSQEFVEASSLSLSEAGAAEQSEITQGASLDAMARLHAIDMEDLLDDYSTFSDLSALTNHGKRSSGKTRFIKEPSYTGIAIDAGGLLGIPGAWTGTLEDLAAVESWDRPKILQAINATIPLNGALAIDARSRALDWDPKARRLKMLIPIVFGGGTRIGYDPEFGAYDLWAKS